MTHSKHELERLKTEFRNRRLAMYGREPGTYESADEMLTSAKHLRDFCIASGHDLEDLDAFLHEVEDDFQSSLPK